MDILDPIWLRTNPHNSDVLFLSSINIVRNIAGQKFVENSSPRENVLIANMLCNSIEKKTCDEFDYTHKYHLVNLEKTELKMFRERYLLPKKITNDEHAHLYIAESEKKSVLINGKEHISIRVSDCTSDVYSLYESAENIEHFFEEKHVFAFDDEFGYLTSNIKNAGCALVASAVLCIPTLSYFNKDYLENFYKECSALGFVVLNEKGQKATNYDNFIYVRNKYSFGMSENDILNTMSYILNNFIEQELDLRESVISKYKTSIEDKVYRSYNVLKSARLISYQEAKNALLWLRVAVFYDILDVVNIDTINKMLLFLKKGHLDNFSNIDADSKTNYNEMRANYISTFLQ